MRKKNPILGIGLLAGGALIASQMMQTPAEEKAPVNALGFTGTDDLTLDNAIKRTIKSDKELQRLLKGETGTPGATGGTGPTGAAGAPGTSIQNFCNSLIVNGAGELGNNSNWGAGTTLGEVFEGMASIVLSYTETGHVYNGSVFDIDNRRLYKISCNAKTSAVNFYFFLTRYSQAQTALTQASSNHISGVGYGAHANTSFEEKVAYFGGISTTTQNSIGVNTAKTKLSIMATGAGTVTLNKLKIQLVSLGEAVPYNLPYLPKGQTVIDPTTYAMGVYNGTSVVWA